MKLRVEMMSENSNIVFLSNVYPINETPYKDKKFMSHVYDHDKLKEINRKYNVGFSNVPLSDFQLEIIKQLPVCAYSHNDPCWGLIKNANSESWMCKCVNKDCHLFPKCRSDFQISEYNNFSPLLNNTSRDYNYIGCTEDGIQYYSVKLDSDSVEYKPDEFDSFKQKKPSEPIPEEIQETPNIDIVQVLRQEIEDQCTRIEAEISEEPEYLHQEKYESENIHMADEFPENIFAKFETVEQKDIIEASPDETIFVDAGPGTGKTYTLINKINYMVSELEVNPEGIQVLSFTNAAVNEIKSRLEELVNSGNGSRGLRNVDIRTFHSFAWCLIGQANEVYAEQGWEPIALQNMNYEQSINHATLIFEKYPDVVTDLGWEHFIVDEVQDLTDSKARLVLAIVDACLKARIGVTVLGDACQSIYDNLPSNEIEPINSTKFYKRLYKLLYNKSKFLCLNANYRQSDGLIQLTQGFREAILLDDIQKTMESVRKMNADIPNLNKSRDSISIDDIETIRKNKDICFLCRNNGQTLKLSTSFRKRGIPHALNIDDTKENIAPWVGLVFYDYFEPIITFEEFTQRYSLIPDRFKEYSAQDIWNRIQDLMYSQNDFFEVEEILEAIRTCKIDDPVFRLYRNNNYVIVSTIHRAKGREYENVITDISFVYDLAHNEKDLSEYKTLYVAVTRPKRNLFTAELSKNSEIKKKPIYKTGRKRWCQFTYQKLSHFEFVFDTDVNKTSFLINSELPFILSNICQGDEIKLVRRLSEGKISYDIVHSKNDVETVIGKTTNEFVEDLSALIKPNFPVDMPASIENLYVTSVYSYIASKDMQDNENITTSSKKKVWNWVDFCGLGHLKYDTY
jgi:superfamily I DNA/RNA helicase